jgi:hypothetical protein
LSAVRTVVTKKPESVIAELGETVIFTVEATSDPGTPIKYSWFFKRNDQQYELITVTSQGSYFIDDDGTSLNISEVDENNIGSYKVTASNGISEESAEFRLQVPGEGLLSNFRLRQAVMSAAFISR